MTPRWYLHFAWGRPPYALDLPEIVIGRGDGCPLQIDEPTAHEEHARFIVDEQEQVWLEPLGADRTTLQNGRAIAGRIRVSDGDFIQIGHAVLTLRAVAQPGATAGPDARTVLGSEMPEEVRRAVGAKNFVVGDAATEQAPLATVMMESPLAPKVEGRDAQRTVEVNADDILATIRRNNAPTAQMQAAPATAAGTLSSQRAMPTLLGVGPTEMASAPTMIAAIPSQRTLELHRDDSQRTDLEDGEGATAASTEMAAAPTMIGAMPSPMPTPAPSRPRGSTNADITPLPAPLPPPTVSVSDPNTPAAVRPSDADMGFAQEDGPRESTRADKRNSRTSPPLSSVATQQLAAVDPTAALGEPAAPPAAAPPSQRKTAPPSQVATGRLPPVAGAHPARAPQAQYVPPQKGPFGAFSRALDFFQQMFALAGRERAIVKPIIYDLAIATPLSLVISALVFVVNSPSAIYAILGLGTAALYFVDYFCNAMTASLMYDYVQTGRADLEAAKGRVKRSLGGIATFAAVSALLDVAATYARERNDLVAKIVLRILRAIWSTATYVVMPAMVIEGVPFKDAFARSKRLMDQDPTGVGAGVVALSLCSYILGAVLFSAAYFLMGIGARIHPLLGVMLYFTLVNAYWALSGWMKIAYSTCFYVWAQRCEAEGRADEALAPLPLRHALDAG